MAFESTFETSYNEHLDLTNDGKLFHSFGTADSNAGDAVTLLMLGVVDLWLAGHRERITCSGWYLVGSEMKKVFTSTTLPYARNKKRCRCLVPT